MEKKHVYRVFGKTPWNFHVSMTKTKKLFKGKNVNQNAWAKVAEQLSLETGMLLKLS